MQRDEPSFPSQPSAATRPATSPSSASDPSWSRVARWALGALVAATSLAAAHYASAWLVPPYLAVMTWLLWPATDRRARAAAATAPDVAEVRVESSIATWEHAPADETTQDMGAAAETDAASATTALKSKRGRGRGRKARPAPASEPATTVTWIRVGPGKFIRVEGADATAANPAHADAAERDDTAAAPEIPPTSAERPPDEAETAPTVEAETGSVVPVDESEPGAAADDASANAAWTHREEPPEHSDEASEPPEAADALSASCAEESPAPPAEAVGDVGINEPEPEAAADPVGVPAEGDSSDPDAPTRDGPRAELDPDACDDIESAPPPTPPASSIADGPPTSSAGRAHWVTLRERCSRLTRPLRPVAVRAPSRRVTGARRTRRVAVRPRRCSRWDHAQRPWRALHTRSPPHNRAPLRT